MPKPLSPVHAELLIKRAAELVTAVRKCTRETQFTHTPLRLTYDSRESEASYTPLVLSGFNGVDGNFLTEYEVITSYTHAALRKTGGNKVEAAKIMKISRGTLYRRKHRLDIAPAEASNHKRQRIA